MMRNGLWMNHMLESYAVVTQTDHTTSCCTGGRIFAVNANVRDCSDVVRDVGSQPLLDADAVFMIQW